MPKHYGASKSGTATPATVSRSKAQHTAGTSNETPCTICDCAEFRRSKRAYICICGHHCEDHENTHLITKREG